MKIGDGVRCLPLQKGIIYGPVASRRLGRSLGINVSPTRKKACSFNCVYCHYGWTMRKTLDLEPIRDELPTPDQVADALAAYLESDRDVDYITFSGNGETTIHPEFGPVVDRVVSVRDNMVPGTRLAILSNSSTVFDAAIRRTLARLDLRIMKLDCGDEETFRRFNRPTNRVSLEMIVEGLKLLDDFVIQTLLAGGPNGNHNPSSVSGWMKLIGEIRPSSVQLYSLENVPADSTLVEIPRDELGIIARETRHRTGIPVEVF